MLLYINLNIFLVYLCNLLINIFNFDLKKGLNIGFFLLLNLNSTYLIHIRTIYSLLHKKQSN